MSTSHGIDSIEMAPITRLVTMSEFGEYRSVSFPATRFPMAMPNKNTPMIVDHVSIEDPIRGASRRNAICCAMSSAAFETMATTITSRFQRVSLQTLRLIDAPILDKLGSSMLGIVATDGEFDIGVTQIHGGTVSAAHLAVMKRSPRFVRNYKLIVVTPAPTALYRRPLSRGDLVENLRDRESGKRRNHP